MVGLCAGFFSAPVAGGFFLEDLGPEFFPSFGAVYRVTAHVKSIGQMMLTPTPRRALVAVVLVCHGLRVKFVSPTIYGK